MYEQDVECGDWIEVFRTTITSPLVKIIILGAYRENKHPLMTTLGAYRVRITMSVYPIDASKAEHVTGIYLYNNYFNNKEQIYQALADYAVTFNGSNITSVWNGLLLGDK